MTISRNNASRSNRSAISVLARLGGYTVLVLLVAGVAAAHPGGSASEGGHLILEIIRLLTIVFLLYIAVAFGKRVIYPRLRGYFSR